MGKHFFLDLAWSSQVWFLGKGEKNYKLLYEKANDQDLHIFLLKQINLILRMGNLPWIYVLVFANGRRKFR